MDNDRQALKHESFILFVYVIFHCIVQKFVQARYIIRLCHVS